MEVHITELFKAYHAIVNDVYIHIAVGIIILDIITGYAKAFVQHRLNSSVGLIGLCKHIVMILIIIAAYPYLMLLGFKGIAYSIIIFYIATYAISLIENLDGIGVPVPKWLVRRLEKLKNQFDEEPK